MHTIPATSNCSTPRRATWPNTTLGCTSQSSIVSPTPPTYSRRQLPMTYVSIYRNQVWDDWLIPMANMGRKAQETSLEIRSPQTVGIASDKEYALFDVLQRTVKMLKGDRLNEGFREICSR